MDDNTRSWPIGLRRLADVIGAAAAVRLSDTFGGTEDNYIPKTATIRHPFTAVIGLDRLKRLCDQFGGERLDIPRGVYRDLKKAGIIDASGSNRDVALRVGCTQRYVRQVRNSVSGDEEPTLFDERD